MRDMQDAELLTELERILPHVAGGAEFAAKLDRAGPRQAPRPPCPASRSGRRRCSMFMEGARFIFAERPVMLDDKAAARAHARGARLAR